MSAVCYRDREGVGQHVDIAIQEATATMIAPEITRVAYAGRSPGIRLGFLPRRILVGMALDKEILEALAGLSPREIERLTEARITGRTPPRT
jgi:crotonobetainyl-CoA:carnitine CoA-transferase CaiB-like acyl-CoA transferase